MHIQRTTSSALVTLKRVRKKNKSVSSWWSCGYDKDRRSRAKLSLSLSIIRDSFTIIYIFARFLTSKSTRVFDSNDLTCTHVVVEMKTLRKQRGFLQQKNFIGSLGITLDSPGGNVATAEDIFHTFTTFRIHYCRGLLTGLTKYYSLSCLLRELPPELFRRLQNTRVQRISLK